MLMSYARNLMQYIDYYLDFQGIQGDMVTQTIIDKMQSLDRLYYLAAYMGRQDVLAQLNDYYRTLGIYENELIPPDLSPPSDSVQIPERSGKKSVLPTANNPYNEIGKDPCVFSDFILTTLSASPQPSNYNLRSPHRKKSLLPKNRTTRSGGVPYKSGSEKQTLR